MQNEGVSPLKAFFQNRWVRLVLVIDILAIIFVFVLAIDKSTKTAVIDFMISPIDAKITINGKDGYKNGGEAYNFAPGTYEIQISHPNLDTKTFTVDLESDHNTTITTFLSRSNNFSFYALRDNLSSFYRLAEIAAVGDNQTTDNDVSAEAFIADFQKNYNLYLTELPVSYSEYDDNRDLTKYVTARIGYNCNITLCIEAVIFDEEEKTIVEKLLADKGFDLEDLEIDYKIY